MPRIITEAASDCKRGSLVVRGSPDNCDQQLWEELAKWYDGGVGAGNLAWSDVGGSLWEERLNGLSGSERSGHDLFDIDHDIPCDEFPSHIAEQHFKHTTERGPPFSCATSMRCC